MSGLPPPCSAQPVRPPEPPSVTAPLSVLLLLDCHNSLFPSYFSFWGGLHGLQDLSSWTKDGISALGSASAEF